MAGGLGGERVGVGALEVKGLKANGSVAKLWHLGDLCDHGWLTTTYPEALRVTLTHVDVSTHSDGSTHTHTHTPHTYTPWRTQTHM